VILSGGDPLTLHDARLAELAGRLAAIPHVHTLRIHSRLPVVLPQRVDGGLLDWLARLPLRKVLVLHSNHAAEIDADVEDALAAFSEAGVTLLNQAVLLRSVNDNADTLVALSERLHRTGVLPYYLHLLDRVQGAAHFDVPQARGVALIAALRGRLPGYLVPRLVREVPGADGKTVIA
jgi:KamA family protein